MAVKTDESTATPRLQAEELFVIVRPLRLKVKGKKRKQRDLTLLSPSRSERQRKRRCLSPQTLLHVNNIILCILTNM